MWYRRMRAVERRVAELQQRADVLTDRLDKDDRTIRELVHEMEQLEHRPLGGRP